MKQDMKEAEVRGDALGFCIPATKSYMLNAESLQICFPLCSPRALW